MPYTALKPKLVPESKELRAQIPGWGADLDPRNRPGVPKEKFNPQGTGAHWDIPQRQIPRYRRERSCEHTMLTPVYGTTCPPKGLSGLIRRFAYTYSEARATHWGLLMFADRMDVIESSLKEALFGRPDHVIRETGVLGELGHHPLRSRFGQHRTDVKRLPLEWLLYGASAVLIGRALLRRRGLEFIPAPRLLRNRRIFY